MKIGIDIADTIIDVWPSIMEKAREYNKSHSNNEPSNNKFLYLPEHIYNWSNEEANEFWISFGQNITFSSPIKEGVPETLQFLKYIGYKIYFITAKSNNIYANLEKRIINLLNSNNIPFDNIFTQINNKGLFCFENGIDYLIDDSFTNCLGAYKYNITSFLVTNVYNQGRELPDNMYRINKFSEVKKLIRRN